MKINVGCGRHVLDDWVNCDANASALAKRPPEIICDAKSIPLPDGCADVVMAIHLFEHFYRWECESALEEWRRLLRRGGSLILEMPDLYKFCRNILNQAKGRASPDQLGMWGLYGDPRDHDPLMVHRWGWTFTTIKPLLEQHGFEQCVEERPQWHPVGRDVRDFRVTARKA